MPNPYNVGNWVSYPYFYGRVDLANDLLREDRRCTYLVGTRRVGKTSLLRYIETRSSATGLFINLQSCATGPDGTLNGERVVRQLKRELIAKSRANSILTQVQFRVERADTLCDAFEQLAWSAEDNDIQVTILFDEAEKLLDLERSDLEPLRSIMQDSNSLRTILAATKGLSELNDRGRKWGTSPFLFGFVTCPIGALDDQEASALIRQSENPNGPVRADDMLVMEIKHLCGNHPFLIQRLCERLYQNNHGLRAPDKEDLVVDSQLVHFFEIDFAQLSNAEQRIMHALGRRAPQSEAQLHRATKTNPEMLRSFLHGLEQLAYIRRSSNGYEPSSAFLASWLKMLPPENATPHVSDHASFEVVDDDRQHLQELRAMHKRRLHALELQGAQKGNSIDPSVSFEIQDLRAKVQQLDEQLGLA